MSIFREVGLSKYGKDASPVDRHPVGAHCNAQEGTEILMLVLDHGDVVSAVIRELRKTHAPTHLSILDNGSGDDTKEELLNLRRKFPNWISLYISPENRGVAWGSNSLLERIPKGGDFALISSDVFPGDPHWLCHLRACAADDNDIAMVGAKAIYYPKTENSPPQIQTIGSSMPEMATSGAESPTMLGVGLPAWNLTRCFNIALPFFGALYVKGEHHRNFRFDPAYQTPYWEDTDLTMKFALELKKRARFCAKSVVFHVHSVTSVDPNNRARSLGFMRLNGKIFHAKWAPMLTQKTCDWLNAP